MPWQSVTLAARGSRQRRHRAARTLIKNFGAQADHLEGIPRQWQWPGVGARLRAGGARSRTRQATR